jgi:hypothetical protein
VVLTGGNSTLTILRRLAETLIALLNDVTADAAWHTRLASAVATAEHQTAAAEPDPSSKNLRGR